MNKNQSMLFAVTFCVLGCWNPARPQAQPRATLEVDLENYVSYVEDTADVTKYATLPNITPAAPLKNFYTSVIIGDIVAVNGQPAKGTATFYNRRVNLTATPNPGDSLADVGRPNVATAAFELLTPDGRIVGSIMTSGFAGAGTPPPGSPAGQSQGNNTITGGTGAFLGARGTQGQAATAQTIAARSASVMEDPANRRINGGGRVRFLLALIPMSLPQIVSASGVPVVFHADFSAVTAAKPAKAGEVLIVQATGLGPTLPGVPPGQPFPASALQPVNSPVTVSVNGQTAEVINAIGWPGLVDTYRVDFRVPGAAAAGTAAIQLTAAWMNGSPVSLPIQ
jgi:hypothetical protein